MSQYKNLEVCETENKRCTLINAVSAVTAFEPFEVNTIEVVIPDEDVVKKWEEELQVLEKLGKKLQHDCNTIYSSFNELMQDAKDELTNYYHSSPSASYEIARLCFVVGYNSQEAMGALCHISTIVAQDLGYQL